MAVPSNLKSDRGFNMSNNRNDDGLNTTKRDELVREHLLRLGIASVEEAPDGLIEDAHQYADSVLGVGKTD